jgi:hypothetical protein
MLLADVFGTSAFGSMTAMSVAYEIVGFHGYPGFNPGLSMVTEA